MLLVFPYNAEHVFVVPAIHPYDVIVFLVVAALHADRIFSGGGNTLLSQPASGSAVNRIADFFHAGGGAGKGTGDGGPVR